MIKRVSIASNAPNRCLEYVKEQNLVLKGCG